MRPLRLLAFALTALLAGCASPGGPALQATDAAAQAPPMPERIELNRATFILGPSVPGATDFQAVLGLLVPAERTRLHVEVTVTAGAAVDLQMFGVEACEHGFGATFPMGQTLAFDCTAQPGEQALRFKQASPQARFDVAVTATAA